MAVLRRAKLGGKSASFHAAMLIPIDHIQPELREKERFGVIRELVEVLARARAFPREVESKVLSGLRMREETMSTGIGFRLALPHCSLPAIAAPVIAFGRSTEGVQFHSLDGLPVNFVVLFLLPAGEDGFRKHLPFLASTARRLNDRAAFRRLLSCKTALEIKEILDDLSDGGPGEIESSVS